MEDGVSFLTRRAIVHLVDDNRESSETGKEKISLNRIATLKYCTSCKKNIGMHASIDVAGDLSLILFDWIISIDELEREKNK